MELQTKIRTCVKCPLYSFMPAGCYPVPGKGPYNAQIMIVGEALDEDGAILEEPFAGLCGQLLDKMLKEAGLSQESCYITNRVKCHPTNGNKTRPANVDELWKCGEWLNLEIQTIKPKVIFTLGKTALSYFKNLKPKDNLKDLIGKDVGFYVHKVIPLYSLSYLLQRGMTDVNSTVAILRRYAND